MKLENPGLHKIEDWTVDIVCPHCDAGYTICKDDEPLTRGFWFNYYFKCSECGRSFGIARWEIEGRKRRDQRSRRRFGNGPPNTAPYQPSPPPPPKRG